ncbi:MAG: 1-deoxy-D-xylulose-5-phosphate reductoisomerase [Holosporales bacterium]|jgi:1-deoxy-D-xylulose-5-phosphate reductoisomerase|nr:1-deoxy-D-xylulose-5-phosphate reductoisomerase [Holosporales bacterium]
MGTVSKKITIFGSTGVIGQKSIEAAYSAGYEIVAITGHKNCEELIRQAGVCRPRYVCCSDPDSYKKVKSEIMGAKVLPGNEIANISKLEVDCCVMAIAGIASFPPTFACLGHAKRLAIASKEAILLGGKILMDSAKSGNTEIIPLDSEHNAIFRCLQHESQSSVSGIILTASGGSFLDFTEDSLKRVTISDALKNPNWRMGAKVTIDSATLINKAIEIIEASILFDLPINKVSYVIHPESIIHGLAQFHDNSYKALLSYPDMMGPISYAINHQEQQFRCSTPSLNFVDIKKLTFRSPRAWQKRNADLAYSVFNEGKIIAFSIANEIAVSEFLNGRIKFCEIYDSIVRMLNACDRENIGSYDDITALVREYVTKFAKT